VNNTGTKYLRIMKQTVFWREKTESIKSIGIHRYVRTLWNSQTIMQYAIWHSFFIIPSLNICLRVWNHVLLNLLYTNVTVFRLLHKTAKSDSSLRHVYMFLSVWKEQLVSKKNFHILYMRIFPKSLDKITVPLKSDKNKRVLHMDT